MLDRKMVINELRKRGYIAEEKNVVKNGVICDGISIHLPETKMENEKVQSVFGVIYMDTLEEMKEMEKADELDGKTLADLKKLAKEAGIKGYSTMKKDEIIASLNK